MGTSEFICALILDDNFHPLLTLRRDNVFRPGLWEYPNGRRLPEEPLAMAVRRVVFETTQLKAEAGVELATQTFIWDSEIMFRLVSTHNVNGVAQLGTADDLGYFDPLFALKYRKLTPELYCFYSKVVSYIDYVGKG